MRTVLPEVVDTVLIFGLVVKVTSLGEKLVGSVDQVEKAGRDGVAVSHEVLVVPLAHAVAHPRTVVIELGNANVADGAVLGPHRSLNQTRRAKHL